MPCSDRTQSETATNGFNNRKEITKTNSRNCYATHEERYRVVCVGEKRTIVCDLSEHLIRFNICCSPARTSLHQHQCGKNQILWPFYCFLLDTYSKSPQDYGNWYRLQHKSLDATVGTCVCVCVYACEYCSSFYFVSFSVGLISVLKHSISVM